MLDITKNEDGQTRMNMSLMWKFEIFERAEKTIITCNDLLPMSGTLLDILSFLSNKVNICFCYCNYEDTHHYIVCCNKSCSFICYVKIT